MASILSHLTPCLGVAVLADGNTIRTFDGEVYSFAPVPCSYVFAHDFDDFNFTVLLKYSGENPQLVGIEIFGHETVLLIETTKPETMRQFYSTAYPDFNATYGDGQVNVVSRNGWILVYNARRRVLELEVSGFYFGKIAGK